MNRKEIVSDFRKAMAPIVAEQIVAADAAETLAAILDEALEKWESSVVEALHKRLDDWGRVMDGSPDDTLYTLGLRQAIDLVEGKDPFNLTRPVVTEEEMQSDVSDQSD